MVVNNIFKVLCHVFVSENKALNFLFSLSHTTAFYLTLTNSGHSLKPEEKIYVLDSYW